MMINMLLVVKESSVLGSLLRINRYPRLLIAENKAIVADVFFILEDSDYDMEGAIDGQFPSRQA